VAGVGSGGRRYVVVGERWLLASTVHRSPSRIRGRSDGVQQFVGGCSAYVVVGGFPSWMICSTAKIDAFEELAAQARPRLRRALIGVVGIDRVDDAVADALEWACSHAEELLRMENPLGYLYRIALRRGRRHPRRPRLTPPGVDRIPEVEPALVEALRSLPARQRVCVWLAFGCEWTHAEIAGALEIDRSTVGTHVSRGLETLRRQLGGGGDENH